MKVLFLYEQSAKEEDNLWAKRNFEMDAVDEILQAPKKSKSVMPMLARFIV